MEPFYIKTNRVFSPIRKYSWIFTILVAIGGLWYPKLGILVFLIIFSLTLTSLFKGRYWCGNFCPHGSLYDYILLPISRNKRIPKFFKSKILVISFFVLFSLKLLFKFIRVSKIYGTFVFWDKLGFIFVSSYLMVLIVGSILGLLVNPRTWCNFCPMGTLQILLYKLGKSLKVTKNSDKKITIVSKEMCHKCGMCSRVCPMQLSPYTEFSSQNQLDNEKCIRCSTCVKNCPAGILCLNNFAEACRVIEQADIDGYQHKKTFNAKIEDIKNLTDKIIEYTFKVPGTFNLNYTPGQFCLMKIKDNPEMYRAYAISGFNDNERSLNVTIKKVQNGLGTNIISDTFKKGHSIKLIAPMGKELVVNKSNRKIMLIASGIGITPFKPIIEDIIKERGNIQEVKLIYGVRYANEFIYDDYFNKINQENEMFEYKKIVSRDDKWTGEKGYVTDIIKDMTLDGYTFYVCGHKAMIRSTVSKLNQLGVKQENIFYEGQ